MPTSLIEPKTPSRPGVGPMPVRALSPSVQQALSPINANIGCHVCCNFVTVLKISNSREIIYSATQ